MAFEASVNIDTEWDFLLAELLLARRPRADPARAGLSLAWRAAC